MKINKLISIFLIIFLIIIIALFSLNFYQKKLSSTGPSVTIGREQVKVRVADTPEKREVGLSGTSSLNKNEGMLFLFDKEQYPSFWMKGMKYPIDILFINDQTIVTIYENVQPPKNDDAKLPLYQSSKPANIVLELPSGFTKNHKIKVGDYIKISL